MGTGGAFAHYDDFQIRPGIHPGIRPGRMAVTVVLIEGPDTQIDVGMALLKGSELRRQP